MQLWHAPICLALLLAAAPSSAGALDPALAEQLFSDGRKAMERGDYDSACRAFEKSQSLDPAAGTLINLAECLAQQGKLAASWLKWRAAYEALPPDDERRAGVEQRIAALASRVPRLELRLPPNVPGDVQVVRDGATVERWTLGMALPVDPGTHHIVVTHAGYEPSEVQVTLAEGEKRSILLTLGAKQAPALPANAPSAPRAATSEASAPTWAWIVLGIGAASTATGLVAGGIALEQKSRLDDHCERSSGKLACSEAGMNAARTGTTFATIADIAVPVGLFGLAVGGYVVLSRHGAERTSIEARPGPRGATLALTHTFF